MSAHSPARHWVFIYYKTEAAQKPLWMKEGHALCETVRQSAGIAARLMHRPELQIDGASARMTWMETYGPFQADALDTLLQTIEKTRSTNPVWRGVATHVETFIESKVDTPCA